MKLIAIAAALAAVAAPCAFAQQHSPEQWRGHNNGARYFDGGSRGWNGRGYRGPYVGRAWVSPRRYYSSPYAYPYYASPLYVAPYFAAPLYAPAPPVYVERYYIEEAPPAPARIERSYSERSYAQAAPQPQPAQPAAPRFERVTLSAKELFGFDEAKLRLPQPRLDEVATALVRNPGIEGLTITGHTDRIGTESYNLKLSQRRAAAVKAYLVSKGVAASRLNAVGKGEAQPVVQCNDRKMADLIKCLEPNRRVEVEEITIERRIAP